MMRRVEIAERRARVATRQSLHPDFRVDSVEAAAASVVALHATDPASVHLSALARTRHLTPDDVERAIRQDRTLVKTLAMRRTLFVFDRERLPAAVAASGPRVAQKERTSLLRDVERTGLHPDGAAWLDDALEQTRNLLADGLPRSLDELRAALPELRGGTAQGEGRSWGSTIAVGPRVLGILSTRGDIVRIPTTGHWRLPRQIWQATSAWLGGDLEVIPPDVAVRQMVGWWLRRFGPGTEEDLRWWLGGTLAEVRRALTDLEAVPVALAEGTGHLLPDDLEAVPEVSPWAALLPLLDPTTMAWKHRDWYLDAHRPLIMDSVGNAGPTAWWGGRIVGTWHQDGDGHVVTDLFEDVGGEARARLATEAERVAAYCDGVQVVRPWGPSQARRMGEPTAQKLG